MYFPDRRCVRCTLCTLYVYATATYMQLEYSLVVKIAIELHELAYVTMQFFTIQTGSTARDLLPIQPKR